MKVGKGNHKKEVGRDAHQSYFMSLSNGDYNLKDLSIDLTMGRAKFELVEGCQDWILISKKELSDEQYSALLDLFKDPNKVKGGLR